MPGSGGWSGPAQPDKEEIDWHPCPADDGRITFWSFSGDPEGLDRHPKGGGAPDMKAMGTQIVGKFCLQERYEGCLANAHKRFVVTCRSNLDHTRMDLPARGPLGSGQALIQGLPPR